MHNWHVTPDVVLECFNLKENDFFSRSLRLVFEEESFRELQRTLENSRQLARLFNRLALKFFGDQGSVTKSYEKAASSQLRKCPNFWSSWRGYTWRAIEPHSRSVGESCSGLHIRWLAVTEHRKGYFWRAFEEPPKSTSRSGEQSEFCQSRSKLLSSFLRTRPFRWDAARGSKNKSVQINSRWAALLGSFGIRKEWLEEWLEKWLRRLDGNFS